jgi:hypothetical protein
MGVKGLWPVSIVVGLLFLSWLTHIFHYQVLTLASRQQDLKGLAIREGFEHPRGVRAYRLGIDIR